MENNKKLLSQYMDNKKISIDNLLRMYLAISNELLIYHEKNIIYSYLNPQNIFIKNSRDDKGNIKYLAEFKDKQEVETSINEIFYISPEQTGRMNIKPDFCSDLYSLGCIFYEMITGYTPFYDNDASKVIYNHISKKPSVPSEHDNNDIKVIWEIILKLLNKNPEDRYLNTYSLIKDLNKCLYLYINTNTINEFKLDSSSGSNQFKISNKIFGRTDEINEINEYFNLSKKNISKLLIVSGDSGIGKSALIKEAGKLIHNESSYFLDGKFHININEPYGAFIQVFTKYIKEKLSENDAALTEFKNNLIENLGSNYNILMNIIPSIDMIFEDKSQENSQIADEKMCYLAFEKFIETILYTDRKLTIFIDDFQWADEASIKLLKYLLNNIKSNKFLVIIAFRMMELKNKAKDFVYSSNNEKFYSKKLNLKPISKFNISSILTESFYFYGKDVDELSSIIFEKTGGSPFFVRQFIKLLYNNELLVFDVKKGRWTFNINKVLNINCTDNMADFIVENIKKLSRKAIELISLAACIGGNFELKLLAEISNQSLADTYAELMLAVNENFLTINSDYNNILEFSNTSTENVEFRFSHDKIMNAFYNINSNEEKLNKHLLIGENLVKNNLYLLEGVKHINIGIKKIDNKIYVSKKYAKLNYEAGKVALTKGAYADAYVYFSKAKTLLKNNVWREEYDLVFNIYLELLRMEYIRKDIGKADELFNVLIAHSNDIYKKYKIYKIRIKYIISMYEISSAEKYTSEFLSMMGIHINFNPSKEEVKMEKKKLLKKLPKENIKKLFDLPKIENKVIESVLEILNELQAAEYTVKPLAYEMLVYKVIELSLEYGNSASSCLTYCFYGVILIKNYKLIEEGYEFGELAYKLSNKFNKSYYKARVLLNLGFYIAFHKDNNKNFLEYLVNAEKLFSNQGNTTNVGLTITGISLLKVAFDGDLKDVYHKLQEYLHKCESINFRSGILIIVELIQYVERLLGKFNYREKAINCDEKKNILEKEPKYIKFLYYTIIARSQYMFESFEESVKTSREAEKFGWMFIGEFQYINHYFYYSLALIKLYYESDGEVKKSYLKELLDAKNKLQEWAIISTRNFKHKLLLVEAEVLQVYGNNLEAVEAYAIAVKLAIENDFFGDAAIISEETSKFYTRLENTKMALFYLKESLYYYEKWGAKGKVKKINEVINNIYLKYPEYKEKARVLINNSKNNFYDELNSIDLNTVIEASRAISSEIELDQLLKKLIKLLVNNAGAQEGYLLLNSEDEFLIEAEYNFEEENCTMILNSKNYKESNKLSESIVNYVIKTKENVILNDAENNNMFVNDNYIKMRRPKSILCTPIVYKNKLIGIIYLQNNITANVFQKTRIKIVKLLGTQAAISIENAFMYRNIKKDNNNLEKDIISNSRLLNEALERDKLKNEFFANLSHEFRTPLNVILSSQQMFDLYINNNTMTENKVKIEKYNNVMKQNCHRLLRLVNNLIDITKIDAGFFKINIVNSNIVKLVEDIVLSTVPYIEQKGLKLTFDTNTEDKVIACDEDAIERVIMNIIANAVKFSRSDGEIFVTIVDKENCILIKIKDNGIGIPKDKQNIIFDRFVQVDKSLSRTREGSGIGLALSKSLIELHGGKITVNSVLGEYSEFVIELPCRVANLDNIVKEELDCSSNFIEKINIEFSDIYS
jgi:predicted ATPase/signal transduction histidine kinase